MHVHITFRRTPPSYYKALRHGRSHDNRRPSDATRSLDTLDTRLNSGYSSIDPQTSSAGDVPSRSPSSGTDPL
ncbi:hypothetical protein C2E23DRAFT_846568 [Lenzites betulinus]|nr:hypothetical protein C2E23DRAFT_846568 [Lenzites betulinus]